MVGYMPCKEQIIRQNLTTTNTGPDSMLESIFHIYTGADNTNTKLCADADSTSSRI